MMEANLDALQKAMRELKDRRDDLLGRVAIEEDRGLQRLAQVEGWLERVETVGDQVNDLLEARSSEIERLCLFGYYSDNCITSYDYGKEVLKRLEEVKELLSKGVFDVVAKKIPVPKVEKRYIQTTVGLDTKVEMVWKSLMNNERRILGLYGIEGVGKTTLLNRLNNKFVEVENDFDVVIWVVVSKDFRNEGIQDQILGRIRHDDEWEKKTENKKASLINNNLKRKKFVLLLDDIWSEVDLNKIGVPAPTQENGSKIVLTTRSKDVCTYMIADEQIKVDCLSPEEAWEFFQITIGDIPLRSDQDFPTLARTITEKCCGLPLALNVIGKAMACKENVHEWHHAINFLNLAGHEFLGMEKKILSILKLNNDSLKDGEFGSFFSDKNYIHMMKANLEALQKTMQELDNIRDDLLLRVAIEEDRGLQRLDQVKRWLERVETIGAQVNDLLETRSTETEKLCLFGYFSKDCITSYNYGVEVLKILEEVKELLSKKGDFDVVAKKTHVPKAEKMHIQTTFGLDTMVETAWNSLINDESRTLGIYGMGGVGKTALLTRINNKFVEEENDFDVVIWVDVSKYFQDEGIQDQILGRLLVDKDWKQETENEKASLINNNLKRKKFVLLLDDLWRKLDLTKVGVPAPTRENGSRIVLTARLKEVCYYMSVYNLIKVDCLSSDEAWELFRFAIGEIPLECHQYQDIPKLAKTIVKKCCGLPLAINIIGEAMANKEDVHEWFHAIDVLNSAGHEFPGMEERIFPILKLSYDSLMDSEVKVCFLYCSLFPEDCEIPKEMLIGCWIGQGFINGNIYEDGGINQGYVILDLLVRAHLLMNCGFKTRVKMHVVIREMAMWIESGFGKQKETIFVKSGEHVRLMPNDINWEIVRRIALLGTQIEEIPCSPNCPNLSTMLLPSNKLLDISAGFFRLMPQLVVLVLYGNRNLTELPDDISNLGSLQYLNLSLTGITSLPIGLKKLRKLIYLNLEFTEVRDSLVGIATTLPNLQVLKLFYSRVCVDDILVEELTQLEHLKILTADIEDAMILERIQGVDRLARSIRRLCLCNMSAPLVILNTLALEHIQLFDIMRCNISEIKIESGSKERRELSSTYSVGFDHLSDVHIRDLKGQKDLSWLLYAQNLRTLIVGWSPEIEQIINKEKGMSIITKLLERSPYISDPFENLEELELIELDGLTEICWNYPDLPECRSLCIKECPKLPEDIANFERHDDTDDDE